MGYLDRLTNLWRGIVGLWISDTENRNAEAIYEQVIAEGLEKNKKLKKDVSGIVALRNSLQTELEEKERDLAEVTDQLQTAVAEGEDEAAMILIGRKGELSLRVAELGVDLEDVIGKAEEAKAGLVAFQVEIEKLKREKIEMLAKKATSEARIRIQESLDGLSTDADLQALENVRETINKLHAEANVADEIRGASMEKKLAEIKEKTAQNQAEAELAELKAAHAAKVAEEAAAAAAAAEETAAESAVTEELASEAAGEAAGEAGADAGDEAGAPEEVNKTL